MNPDPLPTVGRVAHYVAENGQHLKADISALHTLSAVTLHVSTLPPLPPVTVKTHVEYDPQAKPGTWHYATERHE